MLLASSIIGCNKLFWLLLHFYFCAFDRQVIAAFILLRFQMIRIVKITYTYSISTFSLGSQKGLVFLNVLKAKVVLKDFCLNEVRPKAWGWMKRKARGCMRHKPWGWMRSKSSGWRRHKPWDWMSCKPQGWMRHNPLVKQINNKNK